MLYLCQTIQPTESSLICILLEQGEVGFDWPWDIEARGLPPDPDGTGQLLVLCPEHAFVFDSTNMLSFPQIGVLSPLNL